MLFGVANHYMDVRRATNFMHIHSGEACRWRNEKRNWPQQQRTRKNYLVEFVKISRHEQEGVRR